MKYLDKDTFFAIQTKFRGFLIGDYSFMHTFICTLQFECRAVEKRVKLWFSSIFSMSLLFYPIGITFFSFLKSIEVSLNYGNQWNAFEFYSERREGRNFYFLQISLLGMLFNWWMRGVLCATWIWHVIKKITKWLITDRAQTGNLSRESITLSI